MTVNKITTAPTSNEVTDKINEIIDNIPTVPTVNNATLTITQGGTTKGTFTANASSDVTIALDAGGGSTTLSGLTDVTLTSPASGQVLEYNGSNWVNANSYNRNIGEIVTSTIPLTDAGLHLLDGALISGTGAYADFVTYIAGLVSTYPDLFETESNWQTAVTTYGVCGKFVYDSVNNTVRLPKITGIIEGTTDLTALGDLVQAGLPNITGSFASAFSTTGTGCVSTPTIYNAPSKTRNASGDEKQNSISYIDASRSSSIYGNSSTVQPQTIKVLYYIVIANSTKTDIEVDIDEIATDLNGKADTDLSNVPTSKGILSESYVNGTSWYRVYSDGWCEQGGKPIGTNSSMVNVQLLKPYKDTNYTILNGFANTSGTANRNDPIVIHNISQNGFSMSIQTPSTMYLMWQASGYIN